MEQSLFQSYFIGGFECSSHVLRSGRRLDLLAATRHPNLVSADYRRLQEQGIYTARSGIRWHLIETQPYRYNFAGSVGLVHAARRAGMQIIWDLCHYGWPDDLDIFKPEFVNRFAKLAKAFAQLLANESDDTPYICPINEISFLAWGGGDVEYLNPFARGRGFELKAQLVRATIAAIEAVWDVNPQTRIAFAEPLINVISHPERPQDRGPAESWRLAQYQVFDMIAGRIWPMLGGQERYLDIVGLNYYPENQWFFHGDKIPLTSRLYRPLRSLLDEVEQRYQRPMFIAETGTEGDARVPWFRYVANEVRAACVAGTQLAGICLYPILDYPGWDNDRHCPSGLWGYPNDRGQRELCEPLAAELRRQQRLFDRKGMRPALPGLGKYNDVNTQNFGRQL